MDDPLGDDEPLSVETLSERAYRALEEEIVTLRIPPGTVVSEAILSRRLGVGRTPVREALQRLAREWLVVIMPRRGIVVSEVDPVRQLRVLEARREIERLLIRLAAKRAGRSQRTQFQDIASSMRQAAEDMDGVTFMRLDRALNQLVLVSAGNEFAAAAMSLMNGLSRRFWYLHYKQPGDLSLAASLHAEIADAVADGDQDAAARASDKLVDYVQALARAAFE